MKINWLGIVRTLLLFGAIVAGVPALIEAAVFNGLDVLALVLFSLFLISCFIEVGEHESEE